MTAVTIDFPDPMLEFIDGLVGGKDFGAREDVVRAAIADWQARRDAFHAAVQEGADAYEAGDFVEIDDIQGWLTGLRQRG